MSENAFAGQRRITLVRFALDFFKANLEDLVSDGLLEGFDPLPTAEELDKLKDQIASTSFMSMRISQWD